MQFFWCCPIYLWISSTPSLTRAFAIINRETMTALTNPLTPIADQSTSPKSRSLWQEATWRLVRNRGALTGGIIILLLVLTAIFADFIAPYTFEKQSLLYANDGPTVITRLFPSLKPYALINEQYPIGAHKLGRDLFRRLTYQV